MNGSSSPVYAGENAYLAKEALPQSPINDNVYAINSAQNLAPTFYSSGAPTNIAKDAKKMSDPTREEIQARIDAAEARGDTKIVRMEGKLDLVLQTIQSSREEARDNRRAIIGNLWVIFGAVVVVIGILVTVAPVVFDMGFRWRETIAKEVQDRIQDSTVPKNSK
jgi:hypothetical protein